MESLIPTLRASLGDSQFKFHEITINPIFFIDRPFGAPFPLRDFEVWVEFVFGHDKVGQSLKAPEIKLHFSEAFRFSIDRELPERDLTPLNRLPGNRTLFGHFWLNEGYKEDLMPAAYGSGTQRLFPTDYRGVNEIWQERMRGLTQFPHEFGDPKGAFAFWRSNYEGKQRYKAVNYPCTFDARISPDESGWTVTLRPVLFSLLDTAPMPKCFHLNSDECISLWYFFPYEPYASVANLERMELITFYLSMKVEGSKGCEVNYFPRLPAHYDVRIGKPSLATSPPLPIDPPVWQRVSSFLYPVRSVERAGLDERDEDENLALSLFAEIEDKRMYFTRDFIALVFPLIALNFLGLVAPSKDSEWRGAYMFVYVSVLLLTGVVLERLYKPWRYFSWPPLKRYFLRYWRELNQR